MRSHGAPGSGALPLGIGREPDARESRRSTPGRSVAARVSRPPPVGAPPGRGMARPPVGARPAVAPPTPPTGPRPGRAERLPPGHAKGPRRVGGGSRAVVAWRFLADPRACRPRPGGLGHRRSVHAGRRVPWPFPRATHIGRSVALVVAPDGSPIALAKLATDQEGRDALAREARNLGRLGTLLSPPLSAPEILGSGDGLLVVRAVPWRARWRSWRMPEDVAFALGAFFRAGSRVEVGGCALGPSHGDVAPWNFLDTGGGWLLIDWENADETRTPFYDLMHFFVESYSNLRRPSRKTLVSGLLGGRNWIGAAIAAYARGAGIPASETRPHFLAYLQDSLERVDPRGPAARREVEARHQILHDLSR